MSSSPPLEDDAADSSSATVFVSDASAEAERVAQTLRTGGFAVVDVPLAMLVARVAVQRPRVILVDADADGALDAVARVRELPEAEAIDVVFLGRDEGARPGGEGAERALAAVQPSSGFFPRPVDVSALVRKIELLTGGPEKAAERRNTTPPPSLPSSAHPPGANALPPASMRSPSSRPPPSRHTPVIPSVSLRPVAIPAEAAMLVSSVSRAPRSINAPLSRELEALLHEAEERVGMELMPESAAPSPDEEIEAVLPAEILASLDEPLEEDDMEELLNESVSMPRPTTAGGRASPTTGSGRYASRRTTSSMTPFPGGESGSMTPGPGKTHGGATGAPTTGAYALNTASPTAGFSDAHGSSPLLATMAPPTASSGLAPGYRIHAPTEAPERGASEPELPAVPRASPVPHIARLLGATARPSAPAVVDVVRPSVLGPGDAARALGNAIAERVSGAVCFTSAGIARRVVLRDGDIVTAASASDDESLLAFLGARGDLPRETLQRLAGKVPPFGRHAGAALVANGYLRQDQLWDVLRAHAEWVLGHILQIPQGTAGIEADPPGRLRAEPGVFNAATGANVFLDVARRTISPEDAAARLGGDDARIGDGQRPQLLAECALEGAELELVARARGQRVDELAPSADVPDVVTILYALAQLGVVEPIRGLGGASANDGPTPAEVSALDEDAIRARVRARLQLVDEADYFAILGVAMDATGYEVRRAFLELRRAFEPARILTPQVADLAEDVRKIVSVLDEAYEILRDSARRERYRRAIGDAPQ